MPLLIVELDLVQLAKGQPLPDVLGATGVSGASSAEAA